MRFICLGSIDRERWEAMALAQRQAFQAECLAYDDELRRRGDGQGGIVLDAGCEEVTLRMQNGRLLIAERQVGTQRERACGVLLLEARDLNHIISLLAQHPLVQQGRFDIQTMPQEEWISKAAIQAITPSRRLLAPNFQRPSP